MAIDMQIHDKYITQDEKRVRTRFKIAESDRSTSYAYDDEIKRFCDFERIDFFIKQQKAKGGNSCDVFWYIKLSTKPGAKIEYSIINSKLHNDQ